jgi:hypothetical protein
MRCLLAFLVATALVVQGNPAHAEQAPAGENPPASSTIQRSPAPPSPDPAAELGLGVVQVFAGSGTSLAGLMVSALAAGVTGGWGTLVLSLLTPVAVGGVVCSFGNISSAYEGSCVPPIVGAYIGVLGIIPLAKLGADLYQTPGDEAVLNGALIGAFVGWMVVQPLVSTIAWHIFKRPSALPQPPKSLALASQFRPSLPPSMRRASTTLPGEVGIPLLALSF